MAATGLSLLLVVALFAASARGEIYKCTAKRALPTYQNFPCEFDSLGAVATTSASTAPATADKTRAGRTSGPVVAHDKHVRPAAIASAPRVGMTSEQVRAIWGEPLDTTREEFVKGDIETWTYADSRSVRFDPKGRVTQIKW